MSEDRIMPKYGKDDNTITINKVKEKEVEWHDDYKGFLNINGTVYYVNLKDKKPDWIAGRIVKMPDDKAKEYLEGNPAEEEKKTELKVQDKKDDKDQDKKDDDLDDEIPF